jgi:hypothetical protein
MNFAAAPTDALAAAVAGIDVFDRQPVAVLRVDIAMITVDPGVFDDDVLMAVDIHAEAEKLLLVGRLRTGNTGKRGPLEVDDDVVRSDLHDAVTVSVGDDVRAAFDAN